MDLYVDSVSWGTKGDNKAADLGGVKIVKDGKGDALDVELPFQDLKDKTALNEDYNRWLANLPRRPKQEEAKRDAKTKMEDWYAKKERSVLQNSSIS
jgi:chitin synthase